MRFTLSIIIILFVTYPPCFAQRAGGGDGGGGENVVQLSIDVVGGTGRYCLWMPYILDNRQILSG